MSHAQFLQVGVFRPVIISSSVSACSQCWQAHDSTLPSPTHTLSSLGILVSLGTSGGRRAGQRVGGFAWPPCIGEVLNHQRKGESLNHRCVVSATLAGTCGATSRRPPAVARAYRQSASEKYCAGRWVWQANIDTLGRHRKKNSGL
jgi:hypothetical protein